ncbi:MAG: EAL domain-containing protein [Myxococcales bacterium]|nr:EAL domain-containing protein [Myxococcales bacterium]
MVVGKGKLKAAILRHVETHRFSCEYQPLICISDGEITGYEALSRFQLDGDMVPPSIVFATLQADPTLFFMLEARSKAFQIQHRPSNSQLFVNLDPHVCEEPWQVDHWAATFAHHPQLVVEVLERTTAKNLLAITRLVERLRKAGVRLALDDVGGTHNLFSFDLLEQIQVLKLDGGWFKRLEEPGYHQLLEGLLAFTRERCIQSVMEGVETNEHLEIAQSLGVELVQGYLFREQFREVEGPAPKLPIPPMDGPTEL